MACAVGMDEPVQRHRVASPPKAKHRTAVGRALDHGSCGRAADQLDELACRGSLKAVPTRGPQHRAADREFERPSRLAVFLH